MADTKITALAAITTVDPAADVLPIVDISDTSMAASGTTKKITSNQILGSGGTATLASATITGDLTVDTNVLKVDSANNAVCVGTLTSQNVSAGRGNLTIGGTSSAILNLSINGGDTGYIIHDGTNITFNNRTNGYVEFFANGLAQHRIAPLGVFSWFDGAGGTRMTLNSTGLGVGVSPATKLDVRGTINGNQAIFTGTVNRGLVISTRSDGLADDRTVILNAQHSTGAQGQLVLQTVGTDRLLIDSSGNVGVGVTPSAWGSSLKAFELGAKGNALFTTASVVDGLFMVNNAYFDTGYKYAANGYASRYTHYQGAHQWFNAPSGTAGNAITFTQAMTLDATRNLSVNTTAYIGVGTGVINSTGGLNIVPDNTGSASNRNWSIAANGGAAGNLDFAVSSANNTYPNSAYRMELTSAGALNNTTGTYGTISDLRLKENISDARNYLADLLKLRVVKYSLKEESSAVATKLGFIAQEVEQVFPNLVDQSDVAYDGGEGIRSVKTSVLIPMLLKAIQELTARVEALEA